MRYKPSIYNTRVYDGQDLILYNSFTGAKVKTTDKGRIALINGLLAQKEIEDDGSSLLKSLALHGLVVRQHEDERKKAQLLKMETIMNKNIYLTIMPTEQCNFRCRYCYENFKLGKMDKKTQNGIIHFIRKNIHHYTSVHISWFGGEPLLAFDVIEYISHHVAAICKCAKRPFTANITTNGYLLNLEVYKKLQQYNVVSIQITMDGLQETHDAQRVLANGKPTYTTILNNLLAIKQQTKSAAQKIIIRTNVSREVYEQLDDYMDFYHNAFGDDKRFRYLIRPVGDWGGDAVHCMEKSLMDKKAFSLVYDKIAAKNTLNLSFYEQQLMPGGNICYANMRNSFIIRADGRINKCSCLLDIEDNQLGILSEYGTMDIDMNKHARWIYSKDTPHCTQCSFYVACLNANCPAKNLTPNKYCSCSYEKIYLPETLSMLNRQALIPELT